jgi:hypothetical protein
LRVRVIGDTEEESKRLNDIVVVVERERGAFWVIQPSILSFLRLSDLLDAVNAIGLPLDTFDLYYPWKNETNPEMNNVLLTSFFPSSSQFVDDVGKKKIKTNHENDVAHSGPVLQ